MYEYIKVLLPGRWEQQQLEIEGLLLARRVVLMQGTSLHQ
jgi:hypothetical protein